MLGNVEDSVKAALACDLRHHLTGANHLARLGSGRRHRARAVGREHGVAQLVLRNAQLGAGSVRLCLRRVQSLLRIIKLGARRPAVLQEFLLSPECKPCLGQRRFGRLKVGLRHAQRVLLVLGIEASDHLSRGHQVSHPNEPGDHPSVEAKGEAGLVLCTHLPREGDEFAFAVALHGDRAHGPWLRRRRRRLLAPCHARGEQKAEEQ